jgi:hypothetical protein
MEIVKNFENYVIIRMNDIFPKFNINDDVDILTTSLKENLKFLQNNIPEKYVFKVIKLHHNHYHCDYFKDNKLNFRIDLYGDLLYNKFTIHPRYKFNIILNKVKFNDYFIPSLNDDLALRYMEYIENPNKIKHLKYTEKFNNDEFKKISINDENYMNNYKTRFELAIIWDHGIQYYNEIFKILNENNFKILLIKKISFDNYDTFINNIYYLDTTPKEHIKTKSKYLHKFSKQCIVVLFQNFNYIEHIEQKNTKYETVTCSNILRIKWLIREKFNPRHTNASYQNGPKLSKGITHDHVIHMNDTLNETIHLLKYFKLKEPEYYLNYNVFIPWHLKDSSKTYEIKEVNIDNIKCNIVGRSNISITDTPHFQYVNGSKQSYKEYYEKNIGITLCDDHSPGSFDKLIDTFDYENYSHKENKFLIILNKNFIINDGLHRTCILYKENIKRFKVYIRN